MGIRGLAEYLFVKYAGYEDFTSDPPDTSFGKPINAANARILKDKIILVYDKVAEGITQLPFYAKLNQELTSEFYWKVFQDLINNLAANIEGLNLKEGFEYSVKLIQALNQLREVLAKSKMDRTNFLNMDEGIKNIQDHIWKESKRFLNIHALKGTVIDSPELKGIVNTVVPTWDFGPGKNPSRGLVNKRPKMDTPKRFMDRLEDENLKDEIAKRLGPYSTPEEINQEFIRVKDLDKQTKIDNSKTKYNQSLSGKEKHKLR